MLFTCFQFIQVDHMIYSYHKNMCIFLAGFGTEFECPIEGLPSCIPESWVCDGFYDCDGGIDEEANCTCKCNSFCIMLVCVCMHQRRLKLDLV